MANRVVRAKPMHKWAPRRAFRSIASSNTELLAGQAEFFAGWMFWSIELLVKKGLPRDMADTLYHDAERAFFEYRSLSPVISHGSKGSIHE